MSMKSAEGYRRFHRDVSGNLNVATTDGDSTLVTARSANHVNAFGAVVLRNSTLGAPFFEQGLYNASLASVQTGAAGNWVQFGGGGGSGGIDGCGDEGRGLLQRLRVECADHAGFDASGEHGPGQSHYLFLYCNASDRLGFTYVGDVHRTQSG